MDLLDCFRAMCKKEQLDQMNQWYCNQCKEHVCAFKSLQLWKLPNILIVQVPVTPPLKDASSRECPPYVSRGGDGAMVLCCAAETLPLQQLGVVQDICPAGQD